MGYRYARGGSRMVRNHVLMGVTLLAGSDELFVQVNDVPRECRVGHIVHSRWIQMGIGREDYVADVSNDRPGEVFRLVLQRDCRAWDGAVDVAHAHVALRPSRVAFNPINACHDTGGLNDLDNI